jgi:hypothetical protein
MNDGGFALPEYIHRARSARNCDERQRVQPLRGNTQHWKVYARVLKMISKPLAHLTGIDRYTDTA